MNLQALYVNNGDQISLGEYERLSIGGKLFTFEMGADSIQIAVDIKTVTLKNINKIISALDLASDKIDTIYVSWGTKTKVKRAFGAKTLHKSNTVTFKKRVDGEWTYDKRAKTRTL